MAVYHRTQRLQIYGEKPEVTKLFGDRYRMVVRCKAARDTEAWYNANKDQIFASFGTLYSAQMSVDGIDPRTGEAYPDMCLVSNSASYTQTGEYVISFVYETLTSVWTKEHDDEVTSTDNGLRVLERSEVAAIDTAAPYDEDDVGVATITDGGKTLYLANFQDQTGAESNAQVGRVVTRWAEAGTLSVESRLMNEGVKQTTYTYLVTEGTPTGDIISRSTSNLEGLPTISISVLTSTDGTALTDGGAAKLNYKYQQLVPFTFPGVVDLVREQNHIFPAVRSPVESKVKADVLIYYQSSPTIVDSDYLLDGAIGIWNPSEWCQKISTIDSFVNDSGSVQPAYFNAQGIRGCRTRSAVTVNGNNTTELRSYSGTITPSTLELEETVDTENGKSVYRQVFKYKYDTTNTYFRDGLGVQVFRGPYSVTGTYTVELKWTGSQWQITYTDVIVDPTRTDAVSGDLNYTYSIRAGGWTETYTNVTASTSGTLFTGTGGGADPQDAVWTGITVDAASNEESLSALSLPANTSFGISAAGSWIEGRSVDNGASGKITISGGPNNPLGKRYVLDVSLKKAFEDIDGNTTWMKQVVVADVTPAV